MTSDDIHTALNTSQLAPQDWILARVGRTFARPGGKITYTVLRAERTIYNGSHGWLAVCETSDRREVTLSVSGLRNMHGVTA